MLSNKKIEKLYNKIKYRCTNKIIIKILIIITFLQFCGKIWHKNNFLFNQNNIKINNSEIDFIKNLKKKIKVAFFCRSIKNGGMERMASIFLNYIYNSNIFNIYLLTKKNKEFDEFIIPVNIKRIIIKNGKKLIKVLNEEKIDILVYNFFISKDIRLLNNYKKVKTIFIIHQSIFLYINCFDFNKIKTYNYYRKSKYIISLIPFENDFLFRKWGIKSILMNNFVSYEYYSIIPSDLSSKNILMIGRGNDHAKRFSIGIETMKFIIEEIPDSEMIIISSFKKNSTIKQLVEKLNITNNVKFVGYTSKPEIYFKNASLHIFPSISESFGLVVAETKIFGIPNIIVGIDYTSTVQGGTIIIYDEKPITIAKEAIKILTNKQYRKKLGKEARKSMKKFNNHYLNNKWIKLFISIYKGDNYYNQLRQEDKKISNIMAMKILNNQINLLKTRNKIFNKLNIKNFLSFSYMRNLKKNLK